MNKKRVDYGPRIENGTVAGQSKKRKKKSTWTIRRRVTEEQNLLAALGGTLFF
jgi:hypothetical protein